MPQLSSKGQVTIPANVREKMNLKRGDAVEFEIVGNKYLRLKVNRKPSPQDFYGALKSDKPFPGKDELRRQAGKNLEGKDN